MNRIFFILLLLVFFITACVHSGVNDSLFTVPVFSDTVSWSEFVFQDTMKISWDKPEETNNIFYIGYFTRLFDVQSGDTVQFRPNFTEIFYLWYENERWCTKTTVVLPVGRYLFNISAVNSYGISEISNACWINFIPYESPPLPKPKKPLDPLIEIIKF